MLLTQPEEPGQCMVPDRRLLLCAGLRRAVRQHLRGLKAGRSSKPSPSANGGVRIVLIAIRVLLVLLLASRTSVAIGPYAVTLLSVPSEYRFATATSFLTDGHPIGAVHENGSGSAGTSVPGIWRTADSFIPLWDKSVDGYGGIPRSGYGDAIVGSYSDVRLPLPTPGIPQGRAFIWRPDSGRTDLGLLPFGNSQAVGISRSYLVAGSSEVVADIGGDLYLVPNAFIWSEQAGIRSLGTLGGNFSIAKGISGTGRVVGYSENSSELERAFVWTEQSGMQSIFDDTFGESRSYGISESGLVVGIVEAPRPFGQLKRVAFLLEADGAITEIDTPSANGIEAYGVNDNGVVIGAYTTASSTAPIIWERSTGITEAQRLLPLDSGIEITSLLSINNRGQIIGQGYYKGTVATFVLAPLPEPRTTTLTLILLLSLTKGRRQQY